METEKLMTANNDDFIQERYENMVNIENTMQDVNEIYRDISVIVHNQGDMLDSIEMNITVGVDSVSAGTRELVKAEKHQRYARNSKCCLLLILLVILAIIAIIIGASLSN